MRSKLINAYMYDAMLNHNIVELGPAMQAGQSGLIKEFPAQSGPGEAQEFYAHVYNILGVVGCLSSKGFEINQIIDSLNCVTGVPGRSEYIKSTKLNALTAYFNFFISSILIFIASHDC